MTLTQRFYDTCATYADRVAMVNEDGSSFTFAALAETSRRWTTAVRGVTDRPTVGILLPSCKEFAAAYFGILGAGKTPVPLNLLLSPGQLGYIAKDAGLDTIITSRFIGKLASALTDKPSYVEDLYRAELEPSADVALGESHEPCVLLYTSGTTAEPRGVELTHQNIVSNVEAMVEAIYFSDRDVMICVLPLFHSFAFTTMLALPVCVGIKTVYVPRFSAPKTLQLMEEHRVTALLAIASMFRVMLRSDDLPDRDLSALRLCVAGGEPLPLELTQAFNKAFPVPLLEGYGLTETSPVVCVNRPKRKRDGTAGLAIPGVEVKVVDDAGNELPPNTEGELWTRGPHIMKGYLNRPEGTLEAITDEGWFKTGDMSVIDEDGFIKITGRKKELIISSGENISPIEIEEVIAQHPAVFEVAVIPAPDPSRGEVPKAFVALHESATCDEPELRSFCRNHLPSYKVPRYWVFRDELPHGPTGKLLRRALREE